MAGATGGVGAVGRLSAERVAAWVEASCAAQGVPVKVSDPHVVARVGVLLGVRSATGAQAKLRPVRTAASEPPDRTNPVGIERAGHLGRVDDGVIQHGGDDGSLPVEVQAGPLGA